MADTLRVAVVGCGYWGPNLIRNFTQCKLTEVAVICDRDPQRLKSGGGLCPGARMEADLDVVLGDPTIDAVAIATPPRTHGPLALAALQAGKHVLVEKPLSVSATEAERLVTLAERRGLTLMVDHTFLYSPAINKIRELVESDELGEIYYIDSVRINLGLIQSDVNVLWDLAVHDLSIVDHLVGREPQSVVASGSCHNRLRTADVAHINLDFGENLAASFHVNWLSPVKIRHLIVGGSKKSLVLNDLDQSEPLKVYDRGVKFLDQPEARVGALVSYRLGDVWSPHLERQEPLQNMVRHFAECVQNSTVPLTDGRAGLRMVRILESAQQSLDRGGERVSLISHSHPTPVRMAA